MFKIQMYLFLLSFTWPDPDIEAGTSIITMALVFVDESAKFPFDRQLLLLKLYYSVISFRPDSGVEGNAVNWIYWNLTT